MPIIKEPTLPPEHAITLRAILQKRNMSQSDFAKSAGLSRSDITNMLRGARGVGPATFEKIVLALGELDGARFAEVYFNDMLPNGFAGKVHMVKTGTTKAAQDSVPHDVAWALQTIGNAMKKNEHLRKVVVNLAHCHA